MKNHNKIVMELKKIISAELKSDKPYRNKYGTDLWAFDISFDDGAEGIANGASTSPAWAKEGTLVEANDSTYKTKDGKIIWRIKIPNDYNDGKPDDNGFVVTKSSTGTSTGFTRQPDRGREIAIQACINQACSATAQSPHYRENGYNETFKQAVYEMAKDLLEVRDAISSGSELTVEKNPY